VSYSQARYLHTDSVQVLLQLTG